MKFLSIMNVVKIATLAVLLSGVHTYAAEPTLSEVYQAAHSGRLHEAEAMMTQVLAVHPDSAKAHFVNAEILAKDSRLAEARVELSTAERLQPSLSFAKPVAVDMLKRQLGINTTSIEAAPKPQAAPGNTSIIWGVVIFVAIIIWMIIRSQSRAAAQANAAYGMQPPVNPNPASNPNPAGYYPPQQGAGSGIVNGLATGAAVGAGIVAGEVLMHHLLDDNHPNNNSVPDQNQRIPDNSYDMGGNDFGVNDNGSWDSSSSSDDSGDWS